MGGGHGGPYNRGLQLVSVRCHHAGPQSPCGSQNENTLSSESMAGPGASEGDCASCFPLDPYLSDEI